MDKVYGWCNTNTFTHDGRYDHVQTNECKGFISDKELTEQLLAQARQEPTDAAIGIEARYVAEYRPY